MVSAAVQNVIGPHRICIHSPFLTQRHKESVFSLGAAESAVPSLLNVFQRHTGSLRLVQTTSLTLGLELRARYIAALISLLWVLLCRAVP